MSSDKTKEETKATTITKEEYDATLWEALQYLQETKTEIEEEQILIAPTKEFVTAIVRSNEQIWSLMVFGIFIEASLSFHSHFLKREINLKGYTYDNNPVVIMMRASGNLKINRLLADRINNKVKHMMSLSFNKLKKYHGRGKEILKEKTTKQCAFCCKKGIKKCPCLKERYCSNECQKKDWQLHKHIHNA
jgi:hypothetical protein